MDSKARVLIVDREPATRRALAGALAAFGHDSIPMDHERGVLDRLCSEHYDLLLIDPMLPLVDIAALLVSMAEAGVETGTMLLVGPGEANGKWDEIYPGVRGALEKPDGGDDLKTRIDAALRRKAVGAGDARLGNQWQALFESPHHLIVVTDTRRRILNCNMHLAARLGANTGNLLGRDAHEVLCGGQHPAGECHLGRGAPAGRGARSCHVQLWGRHYDSHSTPLVDHQGGVWGFMSVFNDVTELVRAEHDVRRRLEIERTVAEIFNRIYAAADLDTAFDFALAQIGQWSNAGRATIYMFSEEAEWMTVSHQWCAGEETPRAQQMQRVPASRFRWLMAQLCRQQTILVDDVANLPDEAKAEQENFAASQIKSFMAFPLQLTDRTAGFIALDDIEAARIWREEDRLVLRMTAEVIAGALDRHEREMQNRLLAKSIEQMSEVIMITHPDHTIKYVNPAFERVTGYTADRAIGHHPIELFCNDDLDLKTVETLLDTIETGESWSGRLTWRRADRKTYIADCSISPVFDENGRLLNYITTQRDVDQTIKLEAKLRQAQKLESIGQLAAGIAHEINTPIQYVSDNNQFLNDTFKELIGLVETCRTALGSSGEATVSPEAAEAARRAFDATDFEYLRDEIPRAIGQSREGLLRVAKIVRAMKEFSHPGVQQMVQVDLNNCITSTVEVSRNEWKYVADVEMDLDPALPNVHCYPGELNQALLNLIINAAHAIGEALKAQGGGRGKIGLSTTLHENWVVIGVSDTGTGIPPQIRDKIFDPFFTTKEVGKGTGQGLAIVYSVVRDKHNGWIEVESEVGKGSTFKLIVPIGPPESNATPAAQVDAEARA